MINDEAIFNDGYISMMQDELEKTVMDIVYKIEDDDAETSEYTKKLHNLLSQKRFISLGLELRRYLCSKFGKRNDDGTYTFEITTRRGHTEKVTVSNYLCDDVKTRDMYDNMTNRDENTEKERFDFIIRDDYDVTTDDVGEYVKVMTWAIKKYKDINGTTFFSNLGQCVTRFIKADTDCERNTMFKIGFALHMNSSDMNEFLLRVLREQSYNIRKPNEIIAYYCQSNEERNSYTNYLRILGMYNEKLQSEKSDASVYEGDMLEGLKSSMVSDDDFIDFLVKNQEKFCDFTEIAYDKYMELIEYALKNSLYDENGQTYHTENLEQLAKAILEFVPRRTKVKNNHIENDFVPIREALKIENNEPVIPTDLFSKLPIRDHIEDIERKKVTVGRRDLIFMKFYTFCLKDDIDAFQTDDVKTFTNNDAINLATECNALLRECGFSELYVINRFDYLIYASLYSERPYEMFSDILAAAFNDIDDKVIDDVNDK